jgi:hypothetical protein
MLKVLKAIGFLQILTAIFFLISALPGRGRAVANAHPEVRGGGDKGFGGLDYYDH